MRRIISDHERSGAERLCPCPSPRGDLTVDSRQGCQGPDDYSSTECAALSVINHPPASFLLFCFSHLNGSFFVQRKHINEGIKYQWRWGWLRSLSLPSPVKTSVICAPSQRTVLFRVCTVGAESEPAPRAWRLPGRGRDARTAPEHSLKARVSSASLHI